VDPKPDGPDRRRVPSERKTVEVIDWIVLPDGAAPLVEHPIIVEVENLIVAHYLRVLVQAFGKHRRSATP